MESFPGQLACHVANQKHVGKLCSPFLRCLAQLPGYGFVLSHITTNALLRDCTMVYLFDLSLVCFKIYLSFRPDHLSVILLTPDFAVLSMPRTIMTRDNFCSSAAASFLNTECVSFCLLWYPQRLKNIENTIRMC